MDDKKPKVIIVVGPTASGKSALGVQLAKKYDGEIISADSRQVYRKLDIGTAKTTKEEMGGIPHHLIDIVDIEQVYSAADFKTDAAKAIEKITERSHLPIIVGGTFFYIDTLLGKVNLPEVPPNPALREKLEKKSNEQLLYLLEEKDPRRAAAVDPENRRRLIRALEIANTLDYVPNQPAQQSPYQALTIGIEIDRDELRDRFETRAKEWLKGGLIEEVKDLLEGGVTRERLSEIGFEYRLVLELIDGEIDETKFIEKFIQKNWQYAKRQMTWLKRDASIHWFERDDPEIFNSVSDFLKS